MGLCMSRPVVSWGILHLSIFTLSLAGCGRNAIPSTATLQTPPPPTVLSSPVGPSLTVMSVNLWHKDRPEEMQAVSTHLLHEPDKTPDVILCQEVCFNRSEAEPSTAHVLARDLGFDCRGTKRTSDSEGVAIISRFPIQFYDALHLSAQTSPLLLGFRRVSVMAEMFVPSIGRVRVVNVHLTNWGFEARIRRKQIRETLEWVARRDAQVPAAATFFGGDFNSLPDSDEMAIVRHWGNETGAHFLDYNTRQPSQGNHPGHPDKRIDYIFFYSPMARLAFAGEQLLWKDGVPNGQSPFYWSDHLAVVHRYTVRAMPVASTVE